MGRLQEYLVLSEFQEEKEDVSRVKKISDIQAKKMLEEKCSDALKAYKKGGGFKKTGNFISRITMTAKTMSYGFLDTSKMKPRMSLNTLNYYTLIINNEWGTKWPKRQVIGTAGVYSENRMVGDTWIIFPFNGVRVGVCNKRDMWDSFNVLKRKGVTANRFNDYIHNLLNTHRASGQPYDKSIEEFKMGCLDFDEWVRKALKEEDADFDSPAYKELIELVEYKTDSKHNWFMKEYYPAAGHRLYNSISEVYNPSGFKLLKAGGKLPTKQNEVWFDGPALFVNVRDVEDFIEVI